MTSKLTELTQQKSSAQMEMMSRESVRWLNRKISQLRNPAAIRRDISREKERHRNATQLGYNTKFLLGGLYFFYYNPKTKNDLPYYDIFPLVIPLEKYTDGFLGLNLHYLPTKTRAHFLDLLTDFGSYNAQDELKRVRVSYEILNQTRRYREFAPCLKRYLYSNIKSRIATVMPGEWETAIFLPVEQFQKARQTAVYQESLEEISER